MKYNIAKIARQNPVRKFIRDVPLPAIHARLSTEQQYTVILNKLLRGIAKEVSTSILPAYRYERKITTDVDENIFNRVRGIAAALAAESSALVNRILELESQRHTDMFMKSVKQAVGVDISAVVSQEDLTEYLKTAAARNTGLIRSLSADVVKEVEQFVLKNAIAGGSAKQLRTQLTERFGVAQSRAKLIARDQTAKINSDLNSIRQQQAGIEKYGWLTSADERVRPLHQAINGKIYEWGKPTGAEQGLPPGQPILCRCVAQGVVSFEAKEVKQKAASIENAAIDADMRKYVIAEGKKTGTEHLVGYDAVTGIRFANHTTGQRSHVGISQEIEDAITDSKRKIVLHHNHPSSRSFSPQDIWQLSDKRGLQGLWAHGHNGSSYYAEWKATGGFKDFEFIEGVVRQKLQKMVYPEMTLSADDAAIIHGETVMRAAVRKGLIVYRSDLKLNTKWAVEKHQTLIDSIIEELK